MPCWLLPHINRSQPQVYTWPLSLDPPSHLPPHPSPSRRLRAPDHTASPHRPSAPCAPVLMIPRSSLRLLTLPCRSPPRCPQSSSCLRLHCCPADWLFSNFLFQENFRFTKDLQREFPYTLHAAAPPVTSFITVIHPKEGDTAGSYCQRNSGFNSGISSFSTTVPFLFCCLIQGTT